MLSDIIVAAVEGTSDLRELRLRKLFYDIIRRILKERDLEQLTETVILGPRGRGNLHQGLRFQFGAVS